MFLQRLDFFWCEACGGLDDLDWDASISESLCKFPVLVAQPFLIPNVKLLLQSHVSLPCNRVSAIAFYKFVNPFHLCRFVLLRSKILHVLASGFILDIAVPFKNIKICKAREATKFILAFPSRSNFGAKLKSFYSISRPVSYPFLAYAMLWIAFRFSNFN